MTKRKIYETINDKIHGCYVLWLAMKDIKYYDQFVLLLELYTELKNKSFIKEKQKFIKMYGEINETHKG